MLNTAGCREKSPPQEPRSRMNAAPHPITDSPVPRTKQARPCHNHTAESHTDNLGTLEVRPRTRYKNTNDGRLIED